MILVEKKTSLQSLDSLRLLQRYVLRHFNSYPFPGNQCVHLPIRRFARLPAGCDGRPTCVDCRKCGLHCTYVRSSFQTSRAVREQEDMLSYIQRSSTR